MLTVVTPAAPGGLVTVERVKNELSLSGPDVDSRLEELIEEATALLAAYCGRSGFGEEEVVQTERLTCPRGNIVLLRQPVGTILSITVDGTLLSPDDYEVDEALLYRLVNDGRVWWSGKVVISYTAGFALPGDAPVALSRAALDLVVGMYRGAGRDAGIRSEQVEGVGQRAYFDTRSGTVALSADRTAALVQYRTGWVR